MERQSISFAAGSGAGVPAFVGCPPVCTRVHVCVWVCLRASEVLCVFGCPDLLLCPHLVMCGLGVCEVCLCVGELGVSGHLLMLWMETCLWVCLAVSMSGHVSVILI